MEKVGKANTGGITEYENWSTKGTTLKGGHGQQRWSRRTVVIGNKGSIMERWN